MKIEPKDKIDDLLNEILNELDNLNGQNRMLRVLEASCSLTGSMIDSAHEEVLPVCRSMAWDAWAGMLMETSPMGFNKIVYDREKNIGEVDDAEPSSQNSQRNGLGD